MTRLNPGVRAGSTGILTVFFAVLLVVPLFTGGAVAIEGDQRADLNIQQKDYIETDVEVKRTANQTVYSVRGPSYDIALEGETPENVVDYGVLEGDGQLVYKDEFGLYRFEPPGDGTTTLYWDIRSGNTTQRHVATIKAQDTEYHHLTGEEYSEMQSDAANYSEIESAALDIRPNEPVDKTVGDGLGAIHLLDSPFSQPRSEMFGTIMMMIMTNGGRILAGLIVLAILIPVYMYYRVKNREHKRFQAYEDLDTELDEARLRKARRILQQYEWNDLFADSVAARMRQYFGKNVWEGFKTYKMMRSPARVKTFVLQAMGQEGYVAHVERERTDDDTETPGEVIAARVSTDPDEPHRDLDEKSDTTEIETVQLEKLDVQDDTPGGDREIIDAIPGDQLDDDVFTSDLDLSRLAAPVNHTEIDEGHLLAELDPSFPEDFADEEQFAEVLGDMLHLVVSHDHTDADGETRPEMDFLSFAMEMDTVLADKADFPANHLDKQINYYIADNIDREEQLETAVTDIEVDGIDMQFTGGAPAGGD